MTHLSPALSWLLVLALGAAIFYIAAALFDLVSEHVLTDRADRDDAPDGLGSFADLLHDDYADASTQALAVANNLIAADGCYSADHLIGVHSEGWPFNRAVLPMQRDGSRS